MQFHSLTTIRLSTETRMNKSTQVQTDRLTAEIDYRYQYVPSEHTPIRNTFERIRTQLAQEAEQKSRGQTSDPTPSLNGIQSPDEAYS